MLYKHLKFFTLHSNSRFANGSYAIKGVAATALHTTPIMARKEEFNESHFINPTGNLQFPPHCLVHTKNNDSSPTISPLSRFLVWN